MERANCQKDFYWFHVCPDGYLDLLPRSSETQVVLKERTAAFEKAFIDEFCQILIREDIKSFIEKYGVLRGTDVTTDISEDYYSWIRLANQINLCWLMWSDYITKRPKGYYALSYNTESYTLTISVKQAILYKKFIIMPTEVKNKSLSFLYILESLNMGLRDIPRNLVWQGTTFGFQLQPRTLQDTIWLIFFRFIQTLVGSMHCQYCHKEILVFTRRNRKFCSHKCRQAAYVARKNKGIHEQKF